MPEPEQAFGDLRHNSNPGRVFEISEIGGEINEISAIRG